MSTQKIHECYNPEHDTNPDPNAPRVTWAEEELADEIDKLRTDLITMAKEIAELRRLLYTRTDKE